MKNKSYFLFLLVLMVAMALPQMLAQPGSQPFVFYGEEPWGGSYLGVDTEDVSADRVSALHLKEERGVEVTMVDQDAPAGKAGIKEHDVILNVNNQPVESVEQLRRIIREIPVGRTVNIGISRDGQPLTLKAQLAERKHLNEMDHAFSFTVPPVNIPAIHIPPINMPQIDVPSIVVMPSPARSGLMIENLTPQLGDFFGVKNGTGVLVRSVEKGSRGEQAGFRAGDVVTKINGSPVNDCSDFTRLLRKRADNKAAVTVMRDRKEQTITLTLPEIRHSGALNQAQGCLAESDECGADLKAEIAQLLPEMSTAELKQVRPEMERLNREVRKQFLEHQKDFKKDMEKMNKELRRQQEEIKKQVREWMKDAEI
ncbi:MAG TPA: PDZ domain-containing protein [Terriglobales bacterium]|nr:PDZ domain-containing protein [Terriglobales bacterium]